MQTQPYVNPNNEYQQNTVAEKPKNKLKMLVVFSVALLLLIGAGVFILAKRPSNQPNETIQPAASVTVEITADGFVPKELIIKPNTEVTWINTTDTERQVSANPYPTRDDLPELYSDAPLQQEETYTFRFTRPGQIGYHDPANPEITGIITIE